MLDLLIRGGLVFDGRGSPPRRADVAVRGGRVVRIAERIEEPAVSAVDAAGLWVTPGFVDIHTHYDIELELAPGLSESVRHGVTTVVMGNCSLSLTMGEPRTLADIFLRVENIPGVLVRKWLERRVAWNSPAGYFAHLRTLALGPNVAPLLGHSALRAAAMGLGRSLTVPATDEDLERMEDLAIEAFEAGCIGISVDRVPWHMMSGEHKGRAIPSHHADHRELARLAELCRERDLVFQASPNPHRPLSTLQLLWLCAAVGRPALRASLLTALDAVAFRPLRWFFPATLFAVNRLLRGNLRFQTLTEPFTVYSDGPITPLFEEFSSGVELNDRETREERARLWADPAFRARFKRDWNAPMKTFHRRLERMTVVRCPDRAVEGKTFAELAATRGQEPLDCFMDLLASHDEDLRWISCGGNDRPGPRRALLSHPEIHPGFTDAGAHVRNLSFQDGPLALLREAAQSGFMSAERAVERCTSEVAHWFRLDAGTLEEGARADVVLLDPAGLREPGPAPVEIRDPLLDGTARMVKRGSEKAVRSVFVGGRLAWSGTRAALALGREPLGRVLAPEPSARSRELRLRRRIDERTVEHPFTRYWDVFLLKHRDPRNVALHCLGVVLFYGVCALAAATRDAWWLAALPSSQLVGLLGHTLYEPSFVDGRDAVFSVRASAALNRMFWRVVTGRYFADVRRAQARLERYRLRRSRNADHERDLVAA